MTFGLLRCLLCQGVMPFAKVPRHYITLEYKLTTQIDTIDSIMFKLFCILACFISAVYCGVPLGLHAPAGYAGYGGYGGYGGYAGYAAPVAAVGYAAPIAHVGYAAPVAVAAPAVYVDNTHFSYGYQNPFGNGHVSVARTGPIDAHSYTFRSGTWVKK
uniref:Uncharacterized protein n=1 Tax=Strigamia maritima TaxID=126957 RepID=T1JL58_STRMM